MARLRAIALDLGLTESLKWGKPCYEVDGGNVAIIQPFKEHCSLMFFKGALLADAGGLLVAPGENSQSARQLRFTGAHEIDTVEPAIRKYLREAIDVEKAGLKVPLKNISEHAVPKELELRLKDDAELRAAFNGLTPGRRRAYLMHFAQPKRPATRESRIDKCVPRILAGKGLNDR
ncbi:MAG: YdeI/OmpD-associated family protein [Actinobacteria bacterium]|nr:YdeI/OmpD-associated family protein [Actinomycetota bacterium]